MTTEIWFEAFDSLALISTRSPLNETVTTFFKYCYNPIEVHKIATSKEET